MATTSFTIYSRYTPQERKWPQENNQSLDDTDGPDTWQYDKSFGPRPAPPQFIPASLPTLESDTRHESTSTKPESLGEDLSSWYRSLRTSRQGDKDEKNQQFQEAASTLQPVRRRPREQRNKGNWFIMNAINSQPVDPTQPTSPTLADILARDPPPLPTEEQYSPPVWLEIGPSNKGYAMLQRNGWNEGEPLGPNVVRQRPADQPSYDMINCERDSKDTFVKQEVREMKIEGCDDVSELRRVEVIDLTSSDSDSEDDGLENVDLTLEAATDVTISTSHGNNANNAHGGTALLTPIPTILKSDRLGLGLKAKTVGPYKASQKRVTHNAAAMAAHIRAAEESRRRQRAVGRGHRGYAKQRKQEEAERKNLLAYLNN